ncbi:MAG: DUF6492 family protein [Tepidisphaeraceae bacterium]|jgi:hypothetical protein
MNETLDNRSLVFLTPTFARDYERFCLQRESMHRCAIDIPHIAVVNHEDMPLFSTTPHRDNLRLVSTADVLPPRLEKRRRAWGQQRRRNPRLWFTGRGIHGWGIQQLLKLAAAQLTDAKSIVCLDSDTFFIDRVTPDDFFAPDGKLHLYETTDDLDVQMAEWYARALRFLGLPTMGQPLRRFTHSPVPWRRDVLVDLQRFIESKHSKPWMDAVLGAERIMEYTLYGAFARHVDQLKRVTPHVPALALYYWWPEEGRSLEADFAARLGASRAKMVLVNSNTQQPVSAFRPFVERAWQDAIHA